GGAALRRPERRRAAGRMAGRQQRRGCGRCGRGRRDRLPGGGAADARRPVGHRDGPVRARAGRRAARMSGSMLVWAPDGVPEVAAGDDLAAMLVGALAAADFALADGDVVVVTSKVVSKAEGRAVRVDREEAITSETVRVVAPRRSTRLRQTRPG